MHHHQTGAILRSSLITIAIIAIVLAFAFKLLPKGFSGDVSQIGQGTAVIVLAHSKNSVQSLELMELLGKVRPDYNDRVKFVVVNTDIEEGKIFIAQQRAYSSSLILFDPQGKQIIILGSTTDEATLRLSLDEM